MNVIAFVLAATALTLAVLTFIAVRFQSESSRRRALWRRSNSEDHASQRQDEIGYGSVRTSCWDQIESSVWDSLRESIDNTERDSA